MKNILLFEYAQVAQSLLPFTYTRPVAQIRCGIYTLSEKWEKVLEAKAFYQTAKRLQPLFPNTSESVEWLINGSLCPNEPILEAMQTLEVGQGLFMGNCLLVAKIEGQSGFSFSQGPEVFEKSLHPVPYAGDITLIQEPWHIFKHNGAEIRRDFDRAIANENRHLLQDEFTKVYGNQLFIAEGAKVSAAIINTETGPVYIGKNAEVQEGAIIRGPFAMGEGSVVNMGAKLRGDTTIGPYCKVGGEISNSVLFGYSNKGHDGFLGNSVLGEWCNLGADTNTSNLKNNYQSVKIWDISTGKEKDTETLFCGLFMGDHSKAGINSMFNTGTVVGVGVNIYDAGFPPKKLPSFSWGDAQKRVLYQLNKFLETENTVMARRSKILSEPYVKLLSELHQEAANNFF